MLIVLSRYDTRTTTTEHSLTLWSTADAALINFWLVNSWLYLFLSYKMWHYRWQEGQEGQERQKGQAEEEKEVDWSKSFCECWTMPQTETVTLH